MKLTPELKSKIDAYFENVSDEKFYEIAVLKYGFTEFTLDIENEKFSTCEKSYYDPTNYSTFNDEKNEFSCDYLLAA